VITGDALGEIRVWDANSLTDLGSLAQVNSFIWELDYSPDGTRIAVTVDNGFVYIVDANTGVILDTIATNYPVLSVDWKPDGSEIAFVGVDSDADPTNDLQIEPAPPPFICTTVTDTPALLSAIASANGTPEADTICLEAATYTLDAPITSAITLVGLGAGAEIRGTLRVSGAGRLTLRNVVWSQQ
jgi:dipeptidyl aminopeptidase/acylaminoacyl peptidase